MAGIGGSLAFTPMAGLASGHGDEVVLPRRISGKTVIRANMPAVETNLSDLRLTVEGIRIENNPLVSGGEIEAVLAPWKGRELNFTEFEQAVHAVASYLRANGHPDAQVVVSRTTLADGTLQMAVQGLSTGTPVQPTLAVREFIITGLTIASAEELREVLQPWAERELTVAEMQAAAEAVAIHLRNKGYPLVQAFLPPQRIDDGVVEIAVQEGVVDPASGNGGIVMAQSGQRVRPQVIETILTRAVTPGAPLQSDALERALLVAGDLPGVGTINANLVPGSAPGTTSVEVAVEDEKLVSGAAWVDNYGSRYSGVARANGVLNLNSPLGFGEQFTLNLGLAESMRSVKLAAHAPVGYSGARAGVSFSHLDIGIGKEFASFDLESKTQIASVFGSYPVLRTPSRNVIAAVNVDYKHVQNEVLGQTENDRRIPTATAMVSGDFIDPWRGRNVWSVGLTGGNVDLSGNRSYEIVDAATARTAGGFAKANVGYGRVAAIDEAGLWTWQANVSGQVASKNLDTVEKFQLGGPAGVRAYGVGEGTGDHGWLASLELHRRLPDTPIGDVDLFAFGDVGGVTQHQDPWTNALAAGEPNSYVLSGFGVGAEVAITERGSVRVMLARRTGKNPDTAAGQGDSAAGRIWIVGTIRF